RSGLPGIDDRLHDLQSLVRLGRGTTYANFIGDTEIGRLDVQATEQIVRFGIERRLQRQVHATLGEQIDRCGEDCGRDDGILRGSVWGMRVAARPSGTCERVAGEGQTRGSLVRRLRKRVPEPAG